MRLSKLMRTLAVIITAFFVSAIPAHADPVSTAIAVWSAVSAAASWLAGSTLLAFVVRTVGLSLLTQALGKQKSAAATGVKTSTSTGGATSQTFIVGKYATSGQLVTPLMSYGADGKTPNAYLTYVIAVGCLPGQQLSRLIINDNYVTIGGSEELIGGSTVMGFPLQDDYAGYAWLRYHDGTQTAADALLMQKFTTYPDRPWSADMIGTGIPYVVLVFKVNPELYSGFPTVRFECLGVPLYDPRYDTSVGGDGDQSYDDASTWVTTTNNAVVIYNIHRGIPLPDGSFWGGEAPASRLPLDSWFAAMNACDELVTLEDESTEPAYECGLEISLADQPADVMEALEIACSAQQVEIGGVWKIRVGGPGLPVMFFTDEDILDDHDKNHDMFPGLDDTHNGIQATHPLPTALWDSTDAPPLYNETWEAEDGGRRLVASLSITACYRPTQAQRIMGGYIGDERRFRRHSLSMGPYGTMLEPLDAVAWTSSREGYTAKVFEISQTQMSPRSLTMAISLRERDALDFVPPSVYLPWVVALPGSHLPVAQAVSGFTVTGSYVEDAAGTPRRAAIVMEWDADGALDAMLVKWEIRLAVSLADVASGTADILKGGIRVAEGILGTTEYQARAQYVIEGRATDWTSWINVTTPDVRFSNLDMPEDVINSLESTAYQTLYNALQVRNLAGWLQGTIYDPNGKSIQTISIDAKNVSNNGITTLNLIGALSAERNAFVFHMNDVFVDPTTSFASYLSGVQSSFDDNEASITELFETTNGLSAEVTLVTNVNGHVTGVKFGTTSTSSYFDIVTSNFRVIDNADPSNIKVPFQIIDGINYLTDTQIDGALVVNGTITNNGFAVNAALVPVLVKTLIDFTSSTETPVTVLSGAVVFPNDGLIKIDVDIIDDYTGISASGKWKVEIYLDGVLVKTKNGAALNFAVGSSDGKYAGFVAAGSHSVSIDWTPFDAATEHTARAGSTLEINGFPQVA